MRQGELLAEDYAAALLQRCEAGEHLNAFITLDPPRVLERARESDRNRASGAELGPLHGLPIPVKDSVNTKTTQRRAARRRCGMSIRQRMRS